MRHHSFENTRNFTYPDLLGPLGYWPTTLGSDWIRYYVALVRPSAEEIIPCVRRQAFGKTIGNIVMRTDMRQRNYPSRHRPTTMMVRYG